MWQSWNPYVLRWYQKGPCHLSILGLKGSSFMRFLFRFPYFPPKMAPSSLVAADKSSPGAKHTCLKLWSWWFQLNIFPARSCHKLFPSPFSKLTYQQNPPKSFQINPSCWFHPTLLNPKQSTGHLPPSSSIHTTFTTFTTPPRCRLGQNDRWNMASSALRARSEPWPGDTMEMMGNYEQLTNWYGRGPF